MAVAKKMGPRAAKAARRKSAHKQHIKNTYGLAYEQYEAVLEHQGGVCAICGGKRTYNLNVDHDHKTMFVRGLLCRQCNGRLLTACKDNVEILKAAIRYLESPPAIQVLGEHVVPEIANAARSQRRRPRMQTAGQPGGVDGG